VEVFLMNVELFRDIVIIIFGITGTLCFILFLFIIFAVYRQAKVITTLSSDTLTEIKKLINECREALKPIMQIITIIEAVHKGFDLVSRIFEMKKGDEENGKRTMG
jgi:hypothetical protein